MENLKFTTKITIIKSTLFNMLIGLHRRKILSCQRWWKDALQIQCPVLLKILNIIGHFFFLTQYIAAQSQYHRIWKHSVYYIAKLRESPFLPLLLIVPVNTIKEWN